MKTIEIDYPCSDGKPTAETDLHWDWIVTITQRLKRFFAGKRVYVASNLLIYYQEGDPRKSLAPDTFVVKNCKPGRRRVFQICTERKTPAFVLETTSRSTRREDAGKKKRIYAQLRVPEYFLYDPYGEWLKPWLQGYRLASGAYEMIPAEKMALLRESRKRAGWQDSVWHSPETFMSVRRGDIVRVDWPTATLRPPR